jgi:hypothetical protein
VCVRPRWGNVWNHSTQVISRRLIPISAVEPLERRGRRAGIAAILEASAHHPCEWACLLVLEAGAADRVRLAEAGRGALGIALDVEGDQEDDGDEKAEDGRQERTEANVKADGPAIDRHHTSKRGRQLLDRRRLQGHLGRRELGERHLAAGAQDRRSRRERLGGSKEGSESDKQLCHAEGAGQARNVSTPERAYRAHYALGRAPGVCVQQQSAQQVPSRRNSKGGREGEGGAADALGMVLSVERGEHKISDSLAIVLCQFVGSPPK